MPHTHLTNELGHARVGNGAYQSGSDRGRVRSRGGRQNFEEGRSHSQANRYARTQFSHTYTRHVLFSCTEMVTADGDYSEHDWPLDGQVNSGTLSSEDSRRD